VTYDDAVAALYQAPAEQFVAERKRLAGELKAAGDKDGAARLARLARPPISAWVVDQLWWHARAAFEAMFETAQRLRDGKLEATAAHRDAIAKLRQRASVMLTDAGHGATEATLRRVTQTLSALAAVGGWDPDLPGALGDDRDPPGFEAIGIAAAAAPEPAAKPAAKAHEPAKPRDDSPRREAEEAAARAEAAAERRRAEEAKAKAKAERHRLEAALRTAEGEITVRERDVARLEKELSEARDMVDQAKAVVEDLSSRLSQLPSD